MKVFAIPTLATALLVSSAAAQFGSSSTSFSACWEVSVEHDATYCIQGPICTGSGLAPAGSLCPVKGDVAHADCNDQLASFENDSCVLPVDSTCQIIDTGAWGCVMSSSTSSGEDSNEAGSFVAGSSSGNVINANVLAADGTAEGTATSDGGISAGVVGAVAAAAAAVAAVAGFALYKQQQKNSAEAAQHDHMHTFVDVVTP